MSEFDKLFPKEDEYGYPVEGPEGKSWLDLIVGYIKQKKEGSKPQLDKVVPQ